MTEVYIMNIGGLRSKAVFESCFQQTSFYRQKKISAAKNENDKLRSLGVSVLLDKYLQTKGLREKNMSYNTGVNGKPYFECTLSGESDFEAVICSRIFFNASHSGDYVVCAFSDKSVGCDVECINKKNLRVAKRYFCPSEINYIFGENICEYNKDRSDFDENIYECKKDRSDAWMCESVRVHGTEEKESLKNPEYPYMIERFVRVWTIKEAYLKCLGTGLTKPLDSFEIRGLHEKEITIWDKEFLIQTDYEKSDKAYCEYDKNKKNACNAGKIKKADCKISEIVLENARIAICSADKTEIISHLI